ncbi:MAG: hypothetical protein R3Y08_00200 [Rikenellaceae bacterium]
MKLINKLCYAALFAALSLTTFSCGDEPETTPNKEEVDPNTSDKVSTVKMVSSSEEFYSATSALCTIETKGYESYAYCITKGEVVEPTEAIVIYNDAEEIFEVEDGTVESVIYGLEGNTAYTVEFAFKVADESEYTVETVNFTTAEYDRIVNIIETGFYNIKFAINAPTDTYYRYLIMPRLDRASLQAQFGTPDSEFLAYGAIGQGTQIVDYKDGDLSFLTYGEEDVEAVVKPGSSFVILVAECDAEGALLAPAQPTQVATRGSEKPIVDGYTENGDEDGFSVIAYTCSKLPAPSEGSVDIDITTTEISAFVTITPSEEIYAYTSLLLTPTEMQLFDEWAGENGIGTEMQKMTYPVTGASTTQFTGLSLGVSYTLAVIYSSDELTETRTIEYITVETTESKLPAIELQITDAGSEDPYSVNFNIKCATKDCGTFYYLMNSSQAWSTYLAQGYTYEQMVSIYGVEESNEEILAGINSDEGYVMTFDSWADTENLLAITTSNVDEKAFCSVGTARSAVETARPSVDSELFTTLLGDWTTTYVFKPGWTLNDTASSPMTATFKTTITDDPNFGPATFDSSHEDYAALYDYWVSYAEQTSVANPEEFATEQIAASFKEYVETAAKFKEMYRAQNRLLMVGFTPYVEYSTIDTWDLFCDLDYGAYNTDQLFFDFGPKMYLQIKEDESTVIEVDPAYIAPARSYDMTYYIGSVSCTTFQGLFTNDIPLRREDDDNMTISSLSYTFDDGSVLDNFYLSYYYYDAVGTPYPSTVGFAEPTMTRGYSQAPSTGRYNAPLQLNSIGAPAPISRAKSGHFKRPYMPSFEVEYKTIPCKEVNCSVGILEQYSSKLSL